MLSLQTILERHPSLLILDAASTHVHVGWLTLDRPPQWVSIEGEASSGVFAAMADLAISPQAASAFVFCEGPGSILGIRTVATAIRTWVALAPRPVYSYRSLELTATAHARAGQTVICDARRQSWHATQVAPDRSFGSLVRIPTAALPQEGLITPEGFRQWSTLPSPEPDTVPYEPARLAADLFNAPLFREAPEPDAFLHEDPSYARWTPAVHRAPTAKS